MRISDWSSDVCSSDLTSVIRDTPGHSAHPQEVHREEQNVYADEEDPEMNLTQELVELPAADLREPVIEAGKKRKDRAKRQHIMEVGNHRSEEHTSELQSLMRTSYDVFCLKQKN